MMESFARGFPQSWAFIRGEPYIIGSYAYDVNTDSTKSFGGIDVVQSHSVDGWGLFFFDEDGPDIFDDMGVPEPVNLEIADRGRYMTFRKALFTKHDTLPGYEKCTAVEMDWVADGYEHQKPAEGLSSHLP